MNHKKPNKNIFHLTSSIIRIQGRIDILICKTIIKLGSTSLDLMKKASDDLTFYCARLPFGRLEHCILRFYLRVFISLFAHMQRYLRQLSKIVESPQLDISIQLGRDLNITPIARILESIYLKRSSEWRFLASFNFLLTATLSLRFLEAQVSRYTIQAGTEAVLAKRKRDALYGVPKPLHLHPVQ